MVDENCLVKCCERVIGKPVYVVGVLASGAVLVEGDENQHDVLETLKHETATYGRGQMSSATSEVSH